jgi:hypothetical protein
MQFLSPIQFAAHSGAIVTAADAATVTFDASKGDWQQVTLGGNRTLAVAGDQDGQQLALVLQQDGIGGRSIAGWWAGITWFTADGSPPALAAGAGKRTIVTLKRVAAGAYLGFLAGSQV